MGKGFSAPVGRLRLQITAVLGLVLVLVWLTAWVDIGRNRQQAIHEAEAGTVSDARIFADRLSIRWLVAHATLLVTGTFGTLNGCPPRAPPP